MNRATVGRVVMRMPVASRGQSGALIRDLSAVQGPSNSRDVMMRRSVATEEGPVWQRLAM